MKVQEIEALYKQAQVNGRGEFCPRIGIYKIMSVSNSVCYGKSAKMAKCLWKHKATDKYYSDFIIEIQLESLINNNPNEYAKCTDDQNVIGYELCIETATYYEANRKFSLLWHFLPKPKRSLDELNELAKAGEIDISNLGDFGEDIDDVYIY